MTLAEAGSRLGRALESTFPEFRPIPESRPRTANTIATITGVHYRWTGNERDATIDEQTPVEFKVGFATEPLLSAATEKLRRLGVKFRTDRVGQGMFWLYFDLPAGWRMVQ